MKFQWLGHASFLITLAGGKRIITDPFDASVGYPPPGESADIVTVSHQHYDHNAVVNVAGNPEVVEGDGKHHCGGVVITGIPSYHDADRGSKRGKNTIFVIEAEGLRVCHLGDLGHLPDESIISKIGLVDVLMIPVGGFYTIGPADAGRVVEMLQPGYVLPMHYKTDYIDFPITGPDDFLKLHREFRRTTELEATKGSMPSGTQVVLLDLKQG